MDNLKCCFKNCNNNAVLGSHVRKSHSNEKTADWYLVPSCVNCNNKRGMCCDIKKGTYLIKISKGYFFKKRKDLIKKKRNINYIHFLDKIKIRKI